MREAQDPVDSAWVAFLQGLHLVAGIRAATAIASTIMAVILLHKVPVNAGATQEPAPATAETSSIERAAECAA